MRPSRFPPDAPLYFVTDHALIGEIIHGIAFLFPCDLKIFAVAAQADAVQWASEGPRDL